jgi:hypothetical protein
MALTVFPGSELIRELPWIAELQDNTSTVRVNGGGYRIVSDRPIAVEQLSGYVPAGTNGASRLLPVHALSGNYRVMAWPSFATFPGYFAVVATEDATLVSISTPVNILAGGGLSGTGGSLTLDRGDVVQVLAPTPGSGYANDLSGSMITASAPVVVFAGHDATNIPVGEPYADHLEEQLPPVETLGTDFLVAVPAHPYTFPQRHLVKVVGIEDDTVLTYAPLPPPAGAPATVDAGQAIAFEATADFRITASHPLLVAQYLEGGNPSFYGDPSMGVVVPVSQFRTSHMFVAPLTFPSSWITIVAPEGASVTVDAGAIDPMSFTTVPGTSYAVARLQVGIVNAHRVDAAVPIGVSAYAYASGTSYLFPVGMGLDGAPPPANAFFPWPAAASDGGDLAVSSEAGLNGTPAGLRATVDDTAGLYVQDDTPADEDRYRARFYFDPNGFDPGEAQGHRRTRLFIVFEDGPRRLAAIVLRRLNGSYAIRARARLDDNAQADTPFVPINDGPHAVELDWRRSSGPDALDGSLQLWIDGVSVASLTGLDNASSAVDFVRMGALSVKGGSSGTMYWDEFESRRTTYIGP